MEGCDKKVGEGVQVASPASSSLSPEAVPSIPEVDMHAEEVDRNKADWKKWILGPYKVLLQSDTYKKDVKNGRSRCMKK